MRHGDHGNHGLHRHAGGEFAKLGRKTARRCPFLPTFAHFFRAARRDTARRLRIEMSMVDIKTNQMSTVSRVLPIRPTECRISRELLSHSEPFWAKFPALAPWSRFVPTRSLPSAFAKVRRREYVAATIAVIA
jgi:hypothetical protein